MARSWTEEQRELQVRLAKRSVPLGRLLDSDTRELAGEILAGLAEAGDWQFTGFALLASLQSSAQDAGGRTHGRVQVDLRDTFEQAIADALGMLVAHGLIGPATVNSGSAGEWRITSSGRQAAQDGNWARVDAARRLASDLHPALHGATLANFERGDYDTAVFAAMKEVEVALRVASGLGSENYGSALVTQAMRAGGPFEISGETASERDAFLALFKGAVGVFKNPSSHRTVHFDHPTEAADVVHLADLLLRIIDREDSRRSDQSP